MTFLNGALLAGAAAAAVPLIIHLLHRSRMKTVRWGAMQLLRPSERRTSRRVQWHHLLLLLIRMAIPALLALCMSRPLLRASRLWGSLPKSTCLFLLDDSASMGASHDGFRSMDRAKKAATRFLDALPAGSECCLIRLSHPDQNPEPFSNEKQRIYNRLRDTNPIAFPARIADALASASGRVTRVQSPRRQILLFSDFQSSNWSESEIENCLSALKKLRTLPHPPQLILYDTGPFQAENISIDSLDFPRESITPNQSVTFHATLRNHGDRPQQSRTVLWKIDGKPLATQHLDLQARQSTRATFVHLFPDAGSHSVEVITDSDPLAWDNSRAASVLVHPPIPVLLVNGKPSALTLEGETDFVELALQPVSPENAQSSSSLRPRVISTPELRSQTLADFPAILLANTSPLEPGLVASLENHVRSGGGLLFFPGSLTDTEWTNRSLHRDGSGLLPALLREATPAATPSPGGSPGIAEGSFDHPALEIFREDRSALAGFQAHRWFPLLPATAAKENPALILAHLSHGDPLWIERSFGRGIVLQSAIPCSAEWSNFPARPAFVPIMQRMVSHCAHRASPERSLPVGRPLLYCDASGLFKKNLPLQRPDGSRIDLTPGVFGPETRFETQETDLPGIYTLGPDSKTPIHFAAHMQAGESSMDRLPADQIRDIAKRLDARLADSPESLLASTGESPEATEVWQPLLAILLLALFAEQLVQRRFRPQTGAAS